MRAEYELPLLIIFHLTNICFLLELLICTYRLNFLAILAFLQIYFFLFMGYYHEQSIGYLLIQLVISVVFDLAWIILNLFTSIHIAPERHTSNNPFFIAIIVFMVIQIILKCVLAFYLFPYR